MSWTVVKELKEKRAKLFSDANAMRAEVRKAGNDLEGDALTKHDKMLADVEKISTEIEREERSLEIESKLTEKRSFIGRDNSNTVEMPEKDFKRYSLLRAINRLANHQPLDGVEAEVNAELAKKNGKGATGFYVPYDVIYGRAKRALDTTTGTGDIGIDLQGANFIDLLRNQLVIGRLGATVIDGVQGKFAMPKQTAGATAYWVAEAGAPSASNQTIGQVNFAPKTLAAYTDITRQFANQTSNSAEQLVVSDLSQQLAIEMDRVALAGSGSANQPTGILSTNGIGNVQFDGVPSFGDMVDLESAVATANVNITRGGYVTTPRLVGELKQTPRISGAAAGFIYENGQVNGYTALSSNNVPSAQSSGGYRNTVIFGNWTDLVVALWGNGVDITIDPYSLSTSGGLRVVAMQDLDIEVRHAESFAYGDDAHSV
jgi:HK97 family phage major capsid protein